MLDLMRRKKRLKIVLWAVIFSLALGMLLFFVPGMNMGDAVTDTSVASVDGQPIPMQEFALAYQRTIKNYSNSGKNKIDPEMLKAMQVPKQVLNSLITERVVEILAKRMGIEVTPDEVRRAVETHPNLQYQGKFIGIEQYKAVLNTNDISVADFEEGMRYSELSRKLREIITDSTSVSERELRDEFARTNQQTVVDYVILKKDDFGKRVKPTDAELQAYFNGHKEGYKIKEKRRAQYLLVPSSQLIQSIQVTEPEILTEWNQMPHEETVEAAHILLRVDEPSKEAEIKAKAETVLKKAKAGEDFAALAKKYSDDTGSAGRGGLLGPIQRTNAPEIKEFEEVAFSLKPGEMSGLVHTRYGFHIIKVFRHEIPALESSRSSIAASIQSRKAQALAKQKAEQAVTLAAKQKDLSLVARDLGVVVELRDTGFVEKDGNPFAAGISQAIQNEVFELKEINSIGKAVEHPLGYAVPKLLEVQMPKPGDFAQSRNQVEKDFIDSKAKELMQADAKKLSEESGKQGSLEKAAKAMGLSVKTSQPFNISGTPDSEIGSNSSFNQTAFELAPGAVSAPLPIMDNMVVMQAKSRSAFDEAAFQKQKPELRQKLLQEVQEPYFQEYVRKATENLEKEGKIRVNAKALERMY
jgi:peptidyl-prolyl cis-trans isomerase D